MADALLSPITRMVEKLGIWAPAQASPPPPAGRVRDVLEELQKVRSVLDNAEDREVLDASVRLWLRELRAVAYDADDVLDEYDYELTRARAAEEAGIEMTSDPKAKHEPEVSDSATPMNDALFWGRIACRVEKIRNRFDEISRQRDALHLREGDGERRRRVMPLRPPSSSLVNVSTVCGREDEKKRLINGVLLSEGCKGKDLSVVPVLGMGGVGKTTLAQVVYNDKRVRDHFDRRGWICVSDDFRVERLWKKIIEAFTREACKQTELGELQEGLKKEIRWKRFLLVLDDVWNEDLVTWTNFLAPLRYGGKGSIALVTTRNEKVVKIPHMLPSLHLGCLSFDHCWSIFWQQVFRGCDISENQDLVETGKKIVEKCKGLPLAVKVLGGLLRYESDLEKWKDVLQSDMWDLGDRDEILPALKLSYVHLPTNLKRCYVYCSLFPKDFRFSKHHLVHLWMAQGFIQCEGSTEVEDMGAYYFSELLQRSFFQYYDEYGKETVVMHDLIHDLAQSISGIECLRVEYKRAYSLSLETRHLSLVPESYKKTSLLQDMSSLVLGIALRTFLVPSSTEDLAYQHTFQIKFSNEMVQNLKFLRALDLSCIIMYELPDSIKNLKHLRYLNLSRTKIEMLPESLCKLYHLQTLLLKDCDDLRCLPEGIKELTNLRHLDFQNYRQYLVWMPRGIGKLRSLQTLPTFNVGRDAKDCGIEELKDLVSLRGSLNISGLCYMVNAEDSKMADLKNKEGLHELRLSWDDRLNLEHKKQPHVLVSEDLQMKVFENLRPHTNLRVLRIHEYSGLSFPTWVGDVSFSRLLEVEISDCAKFTVLPAFGQLPFLKLLNIWKALSMECIDPESHGCATIGFPSLEMMTLKHLGKWTEWQGVHNGDFPSLGSLVIMECSMLRGVLPNFHSPLPMLKELHLEGCDSLESIPLYNLPTLERLTILRCWQLTSIEFCNPNCPSSSLSSSTGPPLKQMMISGCPRACFSPDDEQQVDLLPCTLQSLNIHSSCQLLVEWCTRDGGRRLAHIPNAQFGPGRDGRLFVTS